MLNNIDDSIENNDQLKALLNTRLPFFLYDENKIKENIQLVKKQLACLGLSTSSSNYFFSMKSNPNLELLKLIALDFYGVDVSSEREYDRAREAEFLAQKISVSGPAKKDLFLTKLLTDKVYAIHIDSRDEYQSILRINSTIKNSETLFNLRLNVDESSSKLGMSFEDCLTIFNDKKMHISGLHFYMGREKFNAGKVSALLNKISKEFCHKDLRLKIFMGPGFSSTDLKILDLKPISEGKLFDFHFEMGRVLLETAGSYFSEILSVKKAISGKKEIIVNGGLQHLAIGLVNIFKRNNEVIKFGKSNQLLKGKNEANIFGSLCLSNDLLAIVDNCPSEITRGDWIYFYPCGAYNLNASASEFIMQDRPKSFLLSGGSVTEI